MRGAAGHQWSSLRVPENAASWWSGRGAAARGMRRTHPVPHPSARTASRASPVIRFVCHALSALSGRAVALYVYIMHDTLPSTHLGCAWGCRGPGLVNEMLTPTKEPLGFGQGVRGHHP